MDSSILREDHNFTRDNLKFVWKVENPASGAPMAGGTMNIAGHELIIYMYEIQKKM